MNVPQQFLDQIRNDAFDLAHDPELGGLRVPAVARSILDRMADAGVAADAQIAYYLHERPTLVAEVHAYACDTEDDVISVFYVIDANEDVSLGDPAPAASVSKESIDRGFRRLEAFVKLAHVGQPPDLDQSQPASELVDLVRAAAASGQRIVLNVLTSGTVSDRAATSTSQKGFEREVWDLDRLTKACGGSGDDRPSINFVDEFGASLPCLITPETEDGLQVFMTWVSGDVLARIYNTYRSRLLERNVRSFLQFAGKVNQGIRETVIHRPARLLPYNNGLSATASSVELDHHSDGLARILAVKDFQIVNGGQTTASIASCERRDGVDVSGVAVAMKLTVVPEDRVDELVPLISKYANTQNRIQEADFSANDPFHISLERLSRSTWTKPTPETPRGTRWFYERSRGQYSDELSSQNTAPGRKRFKTENPTPQKFTKTDLAKYVLSWEQQPSVVSKGGQKCFVELMNRIQREKRPAPDAAEFQRITGLAVLFRRTEKLYGEMGYQGYRAQIVTYTVARLSHALHRCLPWDQIWQDQDIPDYVKPLLARIIRGVRDLIINPPSNRNITEWCKRDDCWSAILGLTVETNVEEALGASSNRASESARVAETEAAVAAIPQEVWYAVSKWARDMNLLHPRQRALSYALGLARARGERPSSKQAAIGRELLIDAVRVGFAHRALSPERLEDLLGDLTL